MKTMQEIDAGFRAASGMADRRTYKIFYSHVHQFPLLVLGHNPGGETDGTDLAASDTFFENWEHDLVRFRLESRYALARPMCELLSHVLDSTSLDVIRQVPMSNVIFHRSRNVKHIRISPRLAAIEAKPFLEAIIQMVSPRAVLLIAKTAYDLFTKFHCVRGTVRSDSETRVFTPNGRYDACIHLSGNAALEATGQDTGLIMVGHPSKYSGREEWNSVLDEVRARLRSLGVSPIESTGALVQVPGLGSHGIQL